MNELTIFQTVELKMTLEHEKGQLLKDFHHQKELVISEHEKEIDNLKDAHKNEMCDFYFESHMLVSEHRHF